MNRIFCFFVVFCSFFLIASARPFRPISPGEDVVQFLEGFALGIEATIGNVTECTNDLNITFNDFAVAWKLLREGFDDLDVSEIEQGLIEMAKGLVEVSIAFEQCGLETLAAEIAALAAEIAKGPEGVVEIIVKEIVNIFYHGKDLTADFNGAISSWESGDYHKSGFFVGEIVAILLED